MSPVQLQALQHYAERQLARQEIARRTSQTSSSLWHPQKGRQTQAYESVADVIGYGGAAGGGKSDLTIGLALTQHRRAVIFRREATQARDLYDRAKTIVAGVGRSNDTTMLIRDLPGDRRLEFAGLKDADDVLKWRGRPHDFLGFDEATEFLELQVRTVAGWLRTTIQGQRCQMVLGFNPPATEEGKWVIRYFAPWLDKNYAGQRAAAGELRWFAMLDGKEVERVDGREFDHNGETVRPTSRTFIPARLSDNPILAATDYDRQLAALPEPLRSQLRYGDFAVGLTDDPWQVIPSAWLDAAVKRWREGVRPQGKVDAYGVDVARGGKDRTTFAPKVRNWFDPIRMFPGAQTDTGMKVVELMSVQPDASDARWQIDVIGVGSSAFDIATANGFATIAMNGAEASEATDKSGHLKFANKRAEWYWKLREGLDPESGEDLAIPDDPELYQDLASVKWKLAGRGIQMEPKEDIQKRLGRSPDKGDALVNAHAQNFPAGWSVVNFYDAFARKAKEA